MDHPETAVFMLDTPSSDPRSAETLLYSYIRNLRMRISHTSLFFLYMIIFSFYDLQIGKRDKYRKLKGFG